MEIHTDRFLHRQLLRIRKNDSVRDEKVIDRRKRLKDKIDISHFDKINLNSNKIYE